MPLASGIFALIAVLYIFKIIFLYLGINRGSNRSVRTDRNEPMVSIVVAARNEEPFIGKCLASLSQLEYPREKLEIIAVNDHSSDETDGEIENCARLDPRIRLVRTEKEQGNLRGKTNAVAAGIAASHGEILMFTDADCTVPATWVRETVKYFTPETGIVGGFTLLEAQNAFGGMQSLDWMILFGISSAMAGWRIPITAIGNNFSVRRAAYDAVGGYGNIPFSVTEDYALVQAVLRTGGYTMEFPLNTGSVVTSNPCVTWKQLFRQKQRWGVGGLNMIPRGMLIAAITWLYRTSLIVAPFFLSAGCWLALFGAGVAADSMFLIFITGKMNIRSYLKYLLHFEIYYTIYAAAIPFIATLSKRVVWKERSL